MRRKYLQHFGHGRCNRQPLSHAPEFVHAHSDQENDELVRCFDGKSSVKDFLHWVNIARFQKAYAQSLLAVCNQAFVRRSHFLLAIGEAFYLCLSDAQCRDFVMIEPFAMNRR